MTLKEGSQQHSSNCIVEIPNDSKVVTMTVVYVHSSWLSLPPPNSFSHTQTNTYRIFLSIVSAWLTGFENADQLVPKLVNATNTVYTTIMTELLPTPTKSHYTFNLRDLSKVFQGMLMAQPNKFKVFDLVFHISRTSCMYIRWYILPCIFGIVVE